MRKHHPVGSVSEANELRLVDLCWVVKAAQHESRWAHPEVADHSKPDVIVVPRIELLLEVVRVLAASRNAVLGGTGPQAM